MVNFASLSFYYQASQLISTSDGISSLGVQKDDTMHSELLSGPLNTFFQHHLQTISKQMLFIDDPWSNPTSMIMLIKSAISINGAFLITNLAEKSDSMHSNAA